MQRYFGDWSNILDLDTLTRILFTLYKQDVELCPEKQNIFRVFKLCPYKSLKVVMLGQDPYPQRGVATGILFGNKTSTKEENLSPSLNIVKRAVIDYTMPRNGVIFDNSLESWAKQGILMINSTLTTEVNKVGIHFELWRPFIRNLLLKLRDNNPGLVYVLFGKQAQSFAVCMNPKDHILTEYHPAYYARNNKEMSSEVFKRIDEILYDKYGEKIKWFEEY